MPEVARESLSLSTREDSQENTASCSAPSRVRRWREPGELISSSALMSTVTKP